MAGRHKWSDIKGDITPQRRARIDAIKTRTRDDTSPRSPSMSCATPEDNHEPDDQDP